MDPEQARAAATEAYAESQEEDDDEEEDEDDDWAEDEDDGYGFDSTAGGRENKLPEHGSNVSGVADGEYRKNKHKKGKRGPKREGTQDKGKRKGPGAVDDLSDDIADFFARVSATESVQIPGSILGQAAEPTAGRVIEEEQAREEKPKSLGGRRRRLSRISMIKRSESENRKE